ICFDYRDDQLAVRDAVRDFARGRIAPNAEKWSEGGTFPFELLPELAQLGLLGLAAPAELGGAGLDILTIALVMEELGAGDGSIALTIAAHNSLCIGHLLVAANDEQKRRWLPPRARGDYLGAWALTEPSSGSDAIAEQSRVVREGNGYVLNGTKQFITNGGVAGFAVVTAGAGERKLSAFGVLRGTRGFRPGKTEKKMGLHASDTSQLVLEDCRVGERDRIGADGEAFSDVKKVLDRGRIGIGATARLLSVVENDEPGAADALRTLYPLTGHAEIVGITGPPGGGKSTLVNRLTGAYRATTDRVAVVAVDPSSPFSGGAILGDRIRMRERFLDEGLFIRSMASRGHSGGLARATSR